VNEATKEEAMTKHFLFGVGMSVAICGAALFGQTTAVGPKVDPTAVIKKASSPPPASAKKTTTAGKNKVKMTTSQTASYWLEELDLDGDGDVEDTNLVWDATDKLLLAYGAVAFTCRNGEPGSAEMLVATNGAGNPRHRPVGSGFWVADLDAGECAAQVAGLWGCKFNTSGKETACGVVSIDEKNKDVVIVTAAK
jgi:hypothetical protein